MNQQPLPTPIPAPVLRSTPLTALGITLAVTLAGCSDPPATDAVAEVSEVAGRAAVEPASTASVTPAEL